MGSSTTLVVFGPKRKRSIENDRNDEDPTICMSDADKRLKTSIVLDTRLACPFFKNDLAKYQDCFKAAYRTWAHVKQHLRRKHCTAVNVGDTIRDTQMQLIEDSTKSRLMSDEERWKVAWNILFPQVEPPTTLYTQNLIDEFVDYTMRGTLDPLQSFDTGLTDESSVMSPAASKAVVNQFVGLLRRRQNSAMSCHTDPRRCEDDTTPLTSISTKLVTELATSQSPQLGSDSFMLSDLDTTASNLAGAADLHGYRFCEDMMNQEDLSDQALWEGLH